MSTIEMIGLFLHLHQVLCAPATVNVLAAARALDLQASFEVLPTSPGVVGWLGADADATIRVGGPSGPLSRVLWVFSDTLMSLYDARTESRLLKNFTMPHSTLGLVECGLAAHCAPGARPSFFWRAEEPEASAAPPGATTIVSFFERAGAPEQTYLWPVMGIPDLASGGDRALILACESGLVYLTCTEFVAIVVTNCSAPSPLDWPYSTHVLPWVPNSTASASWSCCAAISLDPRNASNVYLLGTSHGASGLARAALDDLYAHDWTRVQFWGGAAAGWTMDARLLVANNLALTSETTVTYDPVLSLWYSFRVVGGAYDPERVPQLELYTADAITDALWSLHSGFYAVPAPWSNGSYACYAAKAHPAYASASAASASAAASATESATTVDLVMSWVCNAADGGFGLLFGKGSMNPAVRAYWPQLMRVTLERTSPRA